jgi:hypothetical protein
LHDRPQQQQALKTVYEGIGWEVPHLLEMMPTATDWYFDKAAQINMPRWSQGRVALVGDAAYCASPMPGQGTSLALIGAYVLAGELAAASGDCLRAFSEYESAMRPFIGSESGAGTQILKDNVVRRKQVCQRLASEAVHADNAGTRDRVAYQSLHRTDHQGGQRNFSQRLFVLFEIK